MPKLSDVVVKVRSKNAGPFWVTVDVFCGDAATFARVAAALDTATVAALYGQPAEGMKRFDIADLAVVKFSVPRPVVQGSAADRDMHGAQWAHLLAETEIA
jgi:hypothetical protein